MARLKAELRYRGELDRACPGIAHYNFSASLPKLWALPRGWALPRPTQDAALRTRQGLSALCNPTKE